ncbi:hypothetical protein [Paenarthrobacter nicotinovorans]|uniref:hypothetical protein n=1 Tax=Paenarthrobacter nicotinovorans TaxID=29320 RepID=UPI0039A66BAB
MPETPPFVKLKQMFKEAAEAAGHPISSREAHRQAQGFMLSNAAEASELQHSDETGEEAVKQALLSNIRKYGSLRAPMVLA